MLFILLTTNMTTGKLATMTLKEKLARIGNPYKWDVAQTRRSEPFAQRYTMDALERTDEFLELLSGISEETHMDLWWEACDDGWAVPEDLPKKFFDHVLREIRLSK